MYLVIFLAYPKKSNAAVFKGAGDDGHIRVLTNDKRSIYHAKVIFRSSNMIISPLRCRFFGVAASDPKHPCHATAPQPISAPEWITPTRPKDF